VTATTTPSLLQMGQASHPDLHLGGGWANVNNTPFRLYKHFQHEGGIRTPCIVHWPAGITSPGRWIDDRGHLIDIMATIADVTGTAYPAIFTDPDNSNVRTLLPLEGESLKPHFKPETVADFPDRTLGFEHESNRAWFKGDYKFVTKNFNYFDNSSPADELELYNVAVDPTETNNLATTHTALLGEMIDEWNAWATRVGVPADRLLASVSPAAGLIVNPTSLSPEDPSATVTLEWTGANLPPGATYQISASKPASYPNSDSSGPAAPGSGSVAAVVNPALGAVTFTIAILDGTTQIASAQATVDIAIVPPSLDNDLFVDTFNRSNNGNHDASTAGMSGSLLPSLGVDATYWDSYEAGSTEIDSNRLGMAVGTSGMTETAIRHNFIDSAILSAGGFSVQLRVEEINSTGTDGEDRFGGIAVGLSAAEAQNGGDIGGGSSFRGKFDGSTNGSADFFIDLDREGNVKTFSNGQLLDSTPVGQNTGTLLVCYELSSFAVGAPVTVSAFFNGQPVDLDNSSAAVTRSFVWDAANSNYIGLSARASDFVSLDNLAIRTLPLSNSLAAEYANSSGLSGTNAGPGQDPDHDGDDNFVEWLKAGDPAVSDAGTKLLTLAPSPDGEFRFNYARVNDALKAGLTYTFRYSTDLAGDPATWPEFTPEPISSEALGTTHEMRLVRVPPALVSSNTRLFLLLQVD
jgi:hypothetical protein